MSGFFHGSGSIFRAVLLDPYGTTRKVFAEGARISETPLPRPTSILLETGKAKVNLPGHRNNRRRMFRRLNKCAVPGYAPLCMDSNDPDTVWCAFAKRLMRDVPSPVPSLLKEFGEFVGAFLKTHVAPVRVMDFEEWLASTSYSEVRKEELRQVRSDLRGGRPTLHQSSHIDTFVKSEYYPTWKNARMINSRSDAFKVWSGPMFKSIENEVYKLPEFIKHTPVPERPSKIAELKKAGMRYFATDFEAFESHFTQEIMEMCECQLYRHCLRDSLEDAEFLCSVITGENRMRTRTGVSAKCIARRMSGDMCTSLGNGFTNLMLAKFLAHKKGVQVNGFVEGDDGIFACSEPLLKQDYASLGFTIKIEEIADPCKASFCGMIFAESGQIIREPRSFFMGFGWTQSFLYAGSRIMDELLRAKALSACYETPHCPVIGVLARYALKETEGVVPRFVSDGYHQPRDCVHLEPFSPTADTRQLFADSFGVSIDAQLAAEAAIELGDFEAVSRLIPPTCEQEEYASKFLTII